MRLILPGSSASPRAGAAARGPGVHRIWSRFDATSTHFYRYAKYVQDAKVILDVFVRHVPVEPATLLTFYGDIHSTDGCVSVLAARQLLARGVSPIGRPELVTRAR
ncbi:hypothetical protein [Archangium violaceum]|uniref:hypothetical protein n=1 Tax=Archangium violaceum TaxID=83451 RepID=UPI001EF14A9D|nr:hypothetical protein [Archangium violaceum]